MKKRARWGSHKPLYTKAGIKSSTFADILSCRINAKYSAAKIIAHETCTEIDLWVCGGIGTPETRKAAIKAWAESANKKTRQDRTPDRAN